MIGKTLAHYEITDLLGKGGMGEVYRARDTKLSRDVALKLLPSDVSADPERVARFHREARTLASFLHPNVAAVFGFEEVDGQLALAMELVDGEDLSVRLKSGRLTHVEAIQIARQIATGLEAAHEKGIVHRDLKPSNVRIMPDGKVKILDFGLARAYQGEPVDGIQGDDTTIAASLTTPGTIMGTAAYMSPEQATGSRLDKRADIWAFGVVLFEMLSGKRLFAGGTVSETLADVIRAEVDWAQLPDHTPRALEGLLRRCLVGDPAERLRDIGEARILLSDTAKHEEEAAGERSTGSRSREQFAWLLAFLAVVVATWFATRPESDLTPVTRERRMLNVVLPDRLPIRSEAGNPALSAKGDLIAYFTGDTRGDAHLCVYSLIDGSVREFEDALGRYAFWSPDGGSIGYFHDHRLRKIHLETGLASVVTESGWFPNHGTWTPSGDIYFMSYPEISRAPSEGGAAEPITELDPDAQSEIHIVSSLVPGSDRLLYGKTQDGNSSIQITSLDGQSDRQLIQDGVHPAYLDPGFVLWIDDDNLLGAALEPDEGVLAGSPFLVAEGIKWFSLSASGDLLYEAGSSNRFTQLTWFDRSGAELGTIGEPADYFSPRLSLDESRIAVDISREETLAGDIHWLAVGEDRFLPITFGPADDFQPTWHPLGDRLAFASHRSTPGSIYLKSLRGDPAPSLLYGDKEHLAQPTDWSDDGRFVLMTLRTRDDDDADLWIFDTKSNTAIEYLDTPNRESDGQFSPDGNWVAYMTAEDATINQVYVRRNPATDEKWRVSIERGSNPLWIGDEILFLGRNSTIMSARVDIANSFHSEPPEPLFRVPMRSNRFRQFDASQDGQRILVNRLVESVEAVPLVLLSDWQPRDED